MGKRVASGVYEVDIISALAAHVAAMNNRLDSLSLNANINIVSSFTIRCDWCSESHASEIRSSNPKSVNFVGNYRETKIIPTQILLTQGG